MNKWLSWQPAIHGDTNNAAASHPELVEGSRETACGADSSTLLGMTNNRTDCITYVAMTNQ